MAVCLPVVLFAQMPAVQESDNVEYSLTDIQVACMAFFSL
jgi:hypothetical protein